MASTYLTSTLVMGVLALGVVLLVARGRNWEHYSPPEAESDVGRLARLGQDGRLWIVGFVVLVLGITGMTLAVLGGGSSTLPWVVAAALVVGFLAVGTYAAGRSRGHPHAYAVGEAVIALSGVFLVGLVAWLLNNFEPV